MIYANETAVSVSRSRDEIERTLARYGADAFSFTTEPSRATIQFRVPGQGTTGRMVKLSTSIPDRNSDEFQFTAYRGRRREPSAAEREWEKACRQRWRALALRVKANLEAVALGIMSFDEAFMPFIMLPSGETVGSWLAPQVAQAYSDGQMPPMLVEGRGDKV